MFFREGIFDLFKPNVEKMRTKRDVKGLIRALQYEKSCSVRRDAAVALGEIKDKRAVEPLISALGDGDRDVREASAKALINIGRPAVDFLIKALDSDDSNVRKEAVKVLGEIKDERAIEPLSKALKDENKWVRMESAKALKEINWQPKNDVEKPRIKEEVSNSKEETRLCDLCSHPIDTTKLIRIPLREMQQAVYGGFNPFKIPEIDTSLTIGFVSIFGFNAEQTFQYWRQKVMTDTTDWFLCPKCAEAFKKYAKLAGRGEYEDGNI